MRQLLFTETPPSTGLPDNFDPALDSVELPLNARPEPELSNAPVLVEFENWPPHVDPARTDEVSPNGPVMPESSAAPGVRPEAPFSSVVVHLLVAAAVVISQFHEVELPSDPIPVELVIEQPPPPAPAPEPAQSETKPSPPGRLASENTGNPEKPEDPGSTPPPATETAPPPPEAAAMQPPPPEPPPPKPQETVSASPPKPIPAPPSPKPAPPKPASVKPPIPAPQRLLPIPREVVHTARFPGPAATRDEYLAYLLTLTKEHLDLLPLSVIGERRGVTVVGIRVFGDGTIARIAVVESSGYPDIDQRVERMVAAVGRFPPLPQWIQAPAIDLELRVPFPEGLERR